MYWYTFQWNRARLLDVVNVVPNETDPPSTLRWMVWRSRSFSAKQRSRSGSPTVAVPRNSCRSSRNVHRESCCSLYDLCGGCHQIFFSRDSDAEYSGSWAAAVACA